MSDIGHIHKETGVTLATHVWTTTVASQALIAAPGSGKAIRLRHIVVGASGPGNLHISANTTAGTTSWTYNQTGPFEEQALIKLGDNEPAVLHGAAGIGAGFIRVYYQICAVTGT